MACPAAIIIHLFLYRHKVVTSGGGATGQVMSIIVYHCKPDDIGEILA